MSRANVITQDLSIHKEFVSLKGDCEGYLSLYFRFWHKGLSCVLYTCPRRQVRYLLPKYEALLADPLVSEIELCWENLYGTREIMFYPFNADYLLE